MLIMLYVLRNTRGSCFPATNSLRLVVVISRRELVAEKRWLIGETDHRIP